MMRSKEIFVKGRVAGILAVVILLGGCRSEILQSDQMEIRNSLLGMYQDEVMDNLIRTKLMLPVIQVDYRTMTGTVSSLTKGSASYTREGDTSVYGASSGTNAVHVLKSVPFLGAEQDLTVQLTLTGEPVCDTSIYVAYDQYLYGPGEGKKHKSESGPTTVPTTVPITPDEKSVGSDVSIDQHQVQTNAVYRVELTAPTHPAPPPEPVPQGQLLVSDTRPAEGTYHILKLFQGKWYYVPPESAQAFFELYKRVVLERTKINASSSQNLGDELQLFRLNQLQ